MENVLDLFANIILYQKINIRKEGICMENYDLNNIYSKESIEDTITAFKVYGKCRHQASLKPDDDYVTVEDILHEAIRSAVSDNILPVKVGTGPTISQNETIILPINTKQIEYIQKSLVTSVDILSINPSKIAGADYWDINIKYTFKHNIRFKDENGAEIAINELSRANDSIQRTISELTAKSIYSKTYTLEGGQLSNEGMVCICNLFNPINISTENNAPYVQIQAVANILNPNISIGRYVNADPLLPDELRVDTIIGLFSILKVFRLTTMVVNSLGDGDFPVAPEIKAGDVCDHFNNLPFPFEDFNPQDVFIAKA